MVKLGGIVFISGLLVGLFGAMFDFGWVLLGGFFGVVIGFFAWLIGRGMREHELSEGGDFY